MLQKIALGVASAAAALTLALALALAGFAPGGSSAAATTQAPAVDPVAADPTPAVQVDTVYVKPAPKQKTVTIHNVVKTSDGEREDAHESGGDD